MAFRAGSGGGPAFAASTLRLEPLAAHSAASVSLNDGKAQATVTEGAWRVLDPSGAQLVSLKAGETALLAMASAAALSPAASSAAAGRSPHDARCRSLLRCDAPKALTHVAPSCNLWADADSRGYPIDHRILLMNASLHLDRTA